MIWRRGSKGDKGVGGGESDVHLEDRVNDLLGRARTAGGHGDIDSQVRLTAEAMDVCRMLVGRWPDDPRHVGALAGGLYNLAYRLIQAGRATEATEALDESGRHYSALAAKNPGRYATALCDVRLRVALVLLMEGRYDQAVSRAREAVTAYETIAQGDPRERGFGLVRTHTLIGRALLLGGHPDEALEEFDTALFAAERLREEAGIAGTDFAWLGVAPESFRQAAPEWLGAAVAAMELHDAAGKWAIAADAANVAMRVAGGLAAIGDATAEARFEAVMARAQEIWRAAKNPIRAAGERSRPTDEFMVSAAGLVRGPRQEPDLARISRLAGWGPPPR
jgi:tetratricopeptide (TPR) repeat protein